MPPHVKKKMQVALMGDFLVLLVTLMKYYHHSQHIMLEIM